ncbi:zinc finger MYM-type protein 1-like isoform X1 [Rhopilema esculentum]|uniref:zinc finger MYM-type protein 1-like isoform X1 n=2 Tax=Rhopilema esculentum TaxID=499914 RepID=UPI0031E480DF
MKMNQIAEIDYLFGVSRIFALSSAQGRLTHEQRLGLKKDGRPCPKIEIKNRDSETVYNNFLWMCGDAEKNTYFCWPCLVMGDLSKMKATSFARKSGFQSSGDNLWNLSKRHEKTKMHIINHTAYQLLGNVDVSCALDEVRRRQVQQHNKNASRYSRILKYHISLAVFLSAQGLAFRAHDESKLSSNRGNFIELLDLIANYCSDLQDFLNEEKITYTSHEPQNDLIECVFQEVKEEIQRRIDKSQFLAVMMDETSDVSRVEQSAVSVRLINEGEVEEHLLGIIECSKDTTANTLSSILLKKLEEYKITPQNGGKKLIGQSYDGAATMSGELNGIQKQVQDRFPAEYYNHCVAHRISLCASQSAKKIPKVAKFFDTVDKLIRFFRNSPKRTSQLGHSLPKPGDTRWLLRDAAIGVIDSLYETIGAVLYEMANDKDDKTETQVTARGLCLQIQHIEFVFLLKIYRKIFAHCAPIITVMQNPTLDAVQLSSMLEDFQRFLLNLDCNHIWEDAMLLDPEMPAVRQRNGWRGVEEAVDSTGSWKINLLAISSEIAQKFLEQLLWRFENLTRFKWMELIHPSKFDERKKMPPAKQKELICKVKELYPFAVPDALALEHNLSVLYDNNEIKILLDKIVGCHQLSKKNLYVKSKNFIHSQYLML